MVPGLIQQPPCQTGSAQPQEHQLMLVVGAVEHHRAGDGGEFGDGGVVGLALEFDGAAEIPRPPVLSTASACSWYCPGGGLVHPLT